MGGLKRVGIEKGGWWGIGRQEGKGDGSGVEEKRFSVIYQGKGNVWRVQTRMARRLGAQ